MALLNYTTTIDPTKTLGEIQRILAARGAKQIMTDYGVDGSPVGLSFLVPTAFGDRAFRLPANAEAVHKVLIAQHRKGKVDRRHATPDQAARTAWRIVKDWVEAQMAIIESGMVTIDEVFLPYMVAGPNRATVYQVMQQRHLALPSPAEDAEWEEADEGGQP
jgi:hypothetical protein